MADPTSSDPATGDEGNSRLLGLPPELRTMIYKYALYEESGVTITNTLKLPPLLSTCRQTFDESASLWFSLNNLEILLVDCDATLIEAFRSLAARHGAYTLHFTIIFSFPCHQPCWRNRKNWCHRRWERNDKQVMANSDNDWSALRVVTSATEIVAAAVEERASGEMCEKQLQALRRMAESHDARWKS